jgi:hypothetical protein
LQADENGNYHHDENNINIYFTVRYIGNKLCVVGARFSVSESQNGDWNTKTGVNLKLPSTNYVLSQSQVADSIWIVCCV